MSRMNREIHAALRGVEKDEDGKLAAAFVFPPSFAGFQGHFDNHPVLPGICKIQSVIAVCEKFYGKSFRLKSMRAAKYFAPVVPNEEIYVSFLPEPAESRGLNIRAAFSRGQDKIAQLQLQIEEV